MSTQDQVGEAYVFFQYDKPDDLTEDENLLSDIRSEKTPKELELYLNKLDSIDVGESDKVFAEYIDMARGAGVNYCLAAKLPGASNVMAAEEVSYIFNQMYQVLFDDGNKVIAEILYKDNITDNYKFYGNEI
jgi:hypothetical protein